MQKFDGDFYLIASLGSECWVYITEYGRGYAYWAVWAYLPENILKLLSWWLDISKWSCILPLVFWSIDSSKGSLCAIYSIIFSNLDYFSDFFLKFYYSCSILLTNMLISWFPPVSRGLSSRNLLSITMPICFSLSSITMKYSLTPSMSALNEARMSSYILLIIGGAWAGGTVI